MAVGAVPPARSPHTTPPGMRPRPRGCGWWPPTSTGRPSGSRGRRGSGQDAAELRRREAAVGELRLHVALLAGGPLRVGVAGELGPRPCRRGPGARGQTEPVRPDPAARPRALAALDLRFFGGAVDRWSSRRCVAGRSPRRPRRTRPGWPATAWSSRTPCGRTRGRPSAPRRWSPGFMLCSWRMSPAHASTVCRAGRRGASQPGGGDGDRPPSGWERTGLNRIV